MKGNVKGVNSQVNTRHISIMFPYLMGLSLNSTTAAIILSLKINVLETFCYIFLQMKQEMVELVLSLLSSFITPKSDQ